MNDLKEVLDGILRVAEKSYDVRAIEPRLKDLVSLLGISPGRHEEFLSVLLSLLDPAPKELQLGQPGIVEILEYSMHRLRWPEVREAIQGIASTSVDWRVRRAAERVLEAYEDEWPGGEIYEAYREN